MKTYQQARKQYIDYFGKPTTASAIILAAIIVFAVATIAFSLWNTSAMEDASAKNAKEYASELTTQIAGTVNTDQADVKKSLSGIGDALELLIDDGVEETGSSEYLQTYLQAASGSDQFKFVMFLGSSGNIASVGAVPESISQKTSVQEDIPVIDEAKERGKCVAYIDGDTVLYATPTYRDGELFAVLLAGTSTESLRELVNVQTYRDESNFCLTNREGKLLVASGDGRFDDLKEQLENGSSASSEMSTQLETAIRNGQTGTVSVDLDGQELLLTYAPIEDEDWMMLTLFPTDLFSGIYSAYMERAQGATVGAAIVFMLLLIMIGLTHHNSRKRLEQVAFIDEKTGGINSTEFQLRFSQMSRREDLQRYAIVMLDIKDFKLVNESGGFSMGDEVLRHVYWAIDDTLDKKLGELVSRTEMDHYTLCLRENTEAAVQGRLNAITEAVNENSPVAELGFRIEFKQGACIIDDPGADIAKLEEHARLARKNMDREHINRCTFYTPQLRERIYQSRKLDLLAEESIASHDFEVYYQPKVSMSTGAIKGAEALVRWNHPDRGLISPAEFIPVLEESGRIMALDRYVFEEVCRWLAQREAAGKAPIPVSVNLSRAHFWKDNFVKDYVDIADAHHARHDLLEFEITETVFMEESKHAKIREGIRQMHENGFRCAVDDFGVGYSSLSLVHQMDVDTLKFDRSFFTSLHDAKSQKVARCLMNMARELDMDMVIEGIETQDQIDYLKNEQCDVIQGFYYSRPLPEAEFDEWVAQRS